MVVTLRVVVSVEHYYGGRLFKWNLQDAATDVADAADRTGILFRSFKSAKLIFRLSHNIEFEKGSATGGLYTLDSR